MHLDIPVPVRWMPKEFVRLIMEMCCLDGNLYFLFQDGNQTTVVKILYGVWFVLRWVCVENSSKRALKSSTRTPGSEEKKTLRRSVEKEKGLAKS
jgi:hypothetical protein